MRRRLASLLQLLLLLLLLLLKEGRSALSAPFYGRRVECHATVTRHAPRRPARHSDPLRSADHSLAQSPPHKSHDKPLERDALLSLSAKRATLLIITPRYSIRYILPRPLLNWFTDRHCRICNSRPTNGTVGSPPKAGIGPNQQ